MLTSGPRVLVADGDPAIRFYILKNLKAERYVAADAARGRTVLRTVTEAAPDLIVLGLDLPDMDGLALIRSVRRISLLPIIALSADSGEDTSVAALDLGADDVVRKPFGMRELIARVRNALRRTAQARGETPRFTSGDLDVDLVHRRVRVGGREVHLSRIEYDGLRLLVEGGGKVLTHRELLAAEWGAERAEHVQHLRVAIRALRRKIERDPERPRHILTEPRVGYRMETPATRTAGGHDTRKSA